MILPQVTAMQDPRDQPVQERPAIDPYRATPASKAYSLIMAARERAQAEADMRAYDLQCHAAIEQVRQLVAEYGAARVMAWARNAPHLDATVPYTIFPVAQDGEE